MRTARLKVLVPLSLLLAVGCAGVRARDHVLLPAARQAWAGVEGDVRRGVADLPKREANMVLEEAAEARKLLDAGDREGLRTINWPILRDAALRGIEIREQAGEVGPGVAESLRLRVRKLDDAWRKL